MRGAAGWDGAVCAHAAAANDSAVAGSAYRTNRHTLAGKAAQPGRNAGVVIADSVKKIIGRIDRRCDLIEATVAGNIASQALQGVGADVDQTT